MIIVQECVKKIDFVKNAKELITDHFMPEYERRLTVYLSGLKKGNKKEEEAKPPLKVVKSNEPRQTG